MRSHTSILRASATGQPRTCARPRSARAGFGAQPRQEKPEPGWGAEPHVRTRRAHARPRRSGAGIDRGTRAHARLADAARGVGSPRSTRVGFGAQPRQIEPEPGCGAEPHVRTRRAHARPRGSGAGHRPRNPRTCAARGCGAGRWGPREAPAWGSGRSPDKGSLSRGCGGGAPTFVHGAHMRAREGAARGIDRGTRAHARSRMRRGALGSPRSTRVGFGAQPRQRKPEPGCGGGAPRSYTARTCAPARERRGASGPRERLSRGVGRSPT